jgi:hypothetical protein
METPLWCWSPSTYTPALCQMKVPGPAWPCPALTLLPQLQYRLLGLGTLSTCQQVQAWLFL